MFATLHIAAEYARAEPDAAVLRRALDAGFQHHLAKPVNPAALVHAIASLVGRTSVESGPDAAPSSTSRAASEPA